MNEAKKNGTLISTMVLSKSPTHTSLKKLFKKKSAHKCMGGAEKWNNEKESKRKVRQIDSQWFEAQINCVKVKRA